MAAGDVFNSKGQWIVSLQIVDKTASRFTAINPASRDQLPLQQIDYSAGAGHVRFVQDHYEITLDYTDRVPVRGKIVYEPRSGLYFPPAYLAYTPEFESGYVIPSLRGSYRGSITIGAKTYNFENAQGYHDHNWGIWQQPASQGSAPVSWNWGHAYSEDYALFFGEIFLQGKSKGLFVGVFDDHGYVTMFRPPGIQFSDIEAGVPATLSIKAQKAFTSIDLTGTKQSLVSTNVYSSMDFIQYRMKFDVRLAVDGTTHHFSAIGNAETFRRY
jgi:hypothetical protein